MKDISLIVWLTQLGLTSALPLCGFIFLAVWLRDYFDLGNWILFVGIALGIYSAITGFISTLKTLSKISGDKQKESPPVSFNDHR